MQCEIIRITKTVAFKRVVIFEFGDPIPIGNLKLNLQRRMEELGFDMLSPIQACRLDERILLVVDVPEDWEPPPPGSYV